MRDRERSSKDDEVLVRAAAGGDREALGRLYDRFAPSMLGVAQRMLGDSHEAEDVVHDVFLEVWHRARYYDRGRGTVRTWLMVRLRSRTLDRLRSAKRAAAVALTPELGARAAAGEAGDAAAHDSGFVRRALRELSPDQRAILELGYFAGYSCAEIADHLAVPVGTVKSRMSRAVAHLRVQLEANERERP